MNDNDNEINYYRLMKEDQRTAPKKSKRPSKTKCSRCKKLLEDIYCGYCHESFCIDCLKKCSSCKKYRKAIRKSTDKDPNYLANLL